MKMKPASPPRPQPAAPGAEDLGGRQVQAGEPTAAAVRGSCTCVARVARSIQWHRRRRRRPRNALGTAAGRARRHRTATRALAQVAPQRARAPPAAEEAADPRRLPRGAGADACGPATDASRRGRRRADYVYGLLAEAMPAALQQANGDVPRALERLCREWR